MTYAILIGALSTAAVLCWALWLRSARAKALAAEEAAKVSAAWFRDEALRLAAVVADLKREIERTEVRVVAAMSDSELAARLGRLLSGGDGEPEAVPPTKPGSGGRDSN